MSAASLYPPRPAPYRVTVESGQGSYEQKHYPVPLMGEPRHVVVRRTLRLPNGIPGPWEYAHGEDGPWRCGSHDLACTLTDISEWLDSERWDDNLMRFAHNVLATPYLISALTGTPLKRLLSAWGTTPLDWPSPWWTHAH